MTELADSVPLGQSPLPGGVLSRGESRIRWELRRREVLAAADEIFGRNGYHATCMDDIAARAYMSKPVLYRYFSSKIDLYLEVLQKHIDALVSAVRAALGATTSNQQRVHAAVAAYFDFVDDDPHGYRLLFDTDPSNDPRVRHRVRSATEHCVDAVCDAVVRDSGLGPYHARLLAVGVVGASQVAARHWLTAGHTVAKADAVETTMALCWGGLAGLRDAKHE